MMGNYLIKDMDGRLWARTMTRKQAVRLLKELTDKLNRQLIIEIEAKEEV